MNPYLSHAFQLGRERACRDLGLTKEAGPAWAAIKGVGKKLLVPVGMPLLGAGIGAVAGGEGNRLRGALMGGLGGLGLYGGLRGAGALMRGASGAAVDRRVLGGLLGAGGLGAGLYAGSKIPVPEKEEPGLFSLTPERVEGLKQLVPMAAQLLPAMVQQQGGAGLLPDLSGASSQLAPSPETAYAAQTPELQMSYPEMGGGYPQGM